jgi:glycerol-3-phosphate dehydrogenase
VDSYDLLIVGGGINGCAIARDAAIRGAKVLLVEKDDLASHTSSASSKLIHGGLRYLELGQLRLVRESLREREVLLRTAPHIVRPLRFVLPHCPGMRPHWVVRAGLLVYDILSLRGSLGRSRRVTAREPALQAPLTDRRRLLSYWDAWVDDSRLTILNAVAAAENKAEIATRTELLAARREEGAWRADLSDGRSVTAKALVNAAGPWVADLLTRLEEPAGTKVRLVKGSHITVPRLWEGEHAYILQQADRRVVFALPFGEDLTLIGTTDIEVARPEDASVSPDEIRYLCEAADRYFAAQVLPADVVWSYAGVRALPDDGHRTARTVTRDYRLELSPRPGPPLLTVYGGKITTARALAQQAVDLLRIDGRRSTGWMTLPGGDLYPALMDWLKTLTAWMPLAMLERMSKAYGTRLKDLVGDADSLQALGRHFGAGLYEKEVRWLVGREFARTADDILWRRTKLGLRFTPAQVAGLERWLKRSA